MPGRPDFRLYHSNALDVLAELLARELRQPAPGQGLLEPDVVLIPQVAMRRWLQSTLAQTHGVAANLRFLTPGEFVRDVLDANVPGASEDLDAAALQWRLYAQLSDPAALSGRAFAPLRDYLGGGADALKPWALAGELASIFEKYQAWRRDWLLAWEEGADAFEAQAELWRRVAGGRRHRARRIDDYLSRFGREDGPLPAGMPPRLFAFAALNMSPDVLRVIATQARTGTLHFYVPTPSRRYWGDLPTYAQRLRDDPAESDDENPLLAHWGDAGRDFMAVLGGYEVVHPSMELERYADPEELPDDTPDRDSLLGRLQRDLLHRRAPRPWRKALDRDDPSVQVHACHTRLREVQVLHDRLRALLDDPRFDPPLQAREIAVLAPDIDPYRPHIEAVFGGQGGRDTIPYALADLSPLAGEPLADVFLRLLALPTSRMGVSEVLDLLATPALAQAAGLDAAGIERLHDWLHEAGARWGLDPDHRARHDAPADDAYTWRFALDRLLLGHACGDGDDLAGVAPWTELEGGALDALDALIRVLRVFARFERVFSRALAPTQWCDALLAMLDALLPEQPRVAADQRAIERLRRHIDAFATSAVEAGFERTVPLDVVRAHFQQALSESDTRAPLLTGGVSFARMVPMRLIPFRVICLLGMNDGDYPRRDPAGGLNRMTMELTTPARRFGDRSLREDDRFLFLQLFASAGEAFYLSYLGADPRDGSAREPSVLVSELLDTAAAYHHDRDARQALVLHHTLQPFSPRAFGNAAEPRQFSYLQAWHPAARAVGGVRNGIGPWFGDVLDAAAPDSELSLVALRRFLADPPGQFLRERMGLRLPDEIDHGDDSEPLVAPAGGLERWHLQQCVFDACVEGETKDLAERLRARALLPSGPMGRRALNELLAQVQPYAAALRRWREGDAHTRAFELDLDGVTLFGHLDRLYPHGALRMRLDELHGPAQIAHGLDWLVLSALGDARPLAQLASWGDDGPDVRTRAPIPVPQARAALRELLVIRREGLREPLPLQARSAWRWYDTPRQDEAGRDAAWKAANEQWSGDDRRWGEVQSPALQLALRGRDPFLDDVDGARFRALATRLFDALVHGRVAGAAERAA